MNLNQIIKKKFRIFSNKYNKICVILITKKKKKREEMKEEIQNEYL